jgi:UDP-N-acetylmuramate--alanine ligase
MNIYFCGIGGVGLGPLAEIALDAGHAVQGSDANESVMTRQLAERGVAIDSDQRGKFLQSMHSHQAIDWFVYTSGISDDHPELAMAKSLGIKTSKRDELLQYIIEEKDLSLIAVAGTHGKTTTTAMMVWALQQLGIPVSYSVGTTISYGPSGRYVPGSQYFIYECDEFDRNFLHYHPFMSLITSLDYDHPDTYGTPEDYIEAFRQFLSQSDGCILWQNDANLFGELRDAWLLGDHEVISVALPGEHNRRNASLVVKTLERLSIQGDAVEAVSRFPGSGRRFEKVAPNMYSDYGHHPVEIAATLELARELSEDIVLVYQPHQNLRQRELQSQYTDCFELARDVYWLPTYLTRENPTLPVLSPEQLTENITNHESIHIAVMDDYLWEHVQQARDRDALVLFMGAGSIDGWLRDHLKIHHAANVLVLDEMGDVILQKTNEFPETNSELSPVGDRMSSEDISLKATAIRALQEQTNLQFNPNDITFLRMAPVIEADSSVSLVAYYTLADSDVSNLEVYGGRSFEKVDPNRLEAYSLSNALQSAINQYMHPMS